MDDGRPLQRSARSHLRGTVARVTTGAVNREGVIALDGGPSMAAIITNTSVTELGLTEGVTASAVFKPGRVILGVAA